MSILTQALTAAMSLSPFFLAQALNSSPRSESKDRITLSDSYFGILKTDLESESQFEETFEIPKVEGLTYGWFLKLNSSRKMIQWKEQLFYPPTLVSYSSPTKSKVNSVEREGLDSLVDSMLFKFWTVAPDDPIGKYVSKIYIDDHLLKIFEYHLKETNTESSQYPSTRLESGNLTGEWEYYEETSIRGTISGTIKKGFIFKTISNNIYEVAEYTYEYVYEYMPDVIILTNGVFYKLIIDGFDEPLVCTKINDSKRSLPLKSPSGSVIESYIEDEFEGWEGETLFKLDNGQIWQQSSYAYLYHYAYRPAVIIYWSKGTYNLKVEGVSETISVERLK